MRKLADEVAFEGNRYEAYEARYPAEVGGSRAIVLAHGDPDVSPDNAVAAVATMVIEGVSGGLADDLVVVRADSGCEGMLDALVEAGAVEDTGRRVRVGTRGRRTPWRGCGSVP